MRYSRQVISTVSEFGIVTTTIVGSGLGGGLGFEGKVPEGRGTP
jgi:hypothetical protein